MATRQDPKKPKKEVAATKVVGGPPPAAQTGNVPSAHDPAFFEKVKARIGKRSKDDRNVLLNIPVWGWTGDGKTCALLTMLHYGAAPRHALSLAYVTDQDEFTKVENEVDAYQGLNLNSIAASTKARLSELNEDFIDNATWPPGTDEPTSYVFAVRAINSTLGYLVIPDLQGGSFREVDDVARTVLANAHACVILVQPEQYTNAGADGKRYRDEVMSRLTKCSEAGIAACVMITKSDLYTEPGSIADQTHKELTVLIDSHADLEAEIFRVSVIGPATAAEVSPPLSAVDNDDATLPPPGERHPDQLIRAFVWVIDRALVRPAAEIRDRVPDLTFRRAREDAQPSREPIAEFRKLGEFSDRPGIALCGVSADSFLFIAPDGSLIRATLRDGQFETQNAGSVSGLGAPTSKFVAFHVSGELLVAPSQRTDAVWVGPIGGQLLRTPLPSAVVSWAPVTSRSLIALDATGRLHSIRFEDGKWSQVEFIADFIPPSERLVCSFIEKNNEVLALNGVKAEAIHLGAQGRFGERRKPTLVAPFDGDRFSLNRVGVFAGTNAAGDVLLANATKLHNLGPLRKETQAAFAVPVGGRYLAKIATDLRLSVAFVNGDQIRTSDTAYSPLLSKDPDSIMWSADGQMLLLTFPDGTYSAYKPVGLRT